MAPSNTQPGAKVYKASTVKHIVDHIAHLIMTLKLYGSPSSTSTQRAAVILHEKQLPFEFIHIDLAKGEQKLPEHMERSPFGQVPVLVFNH